MPEFLPAAEVPFHENSVRSDVRDFVEMFKEIHWTGRAVARQLHGISSPNFTSLKWANSQEKYNPFWRKHLDVDFHLLVKICTEEVDKLKTS